MISKRDIQRSDARERKVLGNWGLAKFFAFFILLFFAALLGGFLKFVSMVSAPVLPSPVPQADGIVVWTGRGGGRLEAATQLLQDGHGERLLISGVNAQNSREDIRDLLGLSEELDSCCVDLDYAAEDTIGNARETAAWSKALGYEHILLVTSAYHMPRAKVEIRGAVGPIRITPYPVKSTDHAAWWKDRKQFDRYAQEYGKLLGSLARETRNGSGPHVPVIEDNGTLVPISETPPKQLPKPNPENTP
jgi:uncharacterized SAM-binding protein YcdF (DUF218 family)